jgi:predicted nuclease of predicted toxin-antitoxin system
VKLLFDENLSHRLVAALSGDFPGSEHVRDVGLKGARDTQIWNFARANAFVIVSKDNDFRQRSFVEGPPPKVVWVDVGNHGTPAIIELIRRSRTTLMAFGEDPEAGLLVLSVRRVPA